MLVGVEVLGVEEEQRTKHVDPSCNSHLYNQRFHKKKGAQERLIKKRMMSLAWMEGGGRGGGNDTAEEIALFFFFFFFPLLPLDDSINMAKTFIRLSHLLLNNQDDCIATATATSKIKANSRPLKC